MAAATSQGDPPSYNSNDQTLPHIQNQVSKPALLAALHSHPILGFYKSSMSDMTIGSALDDSKPTFYVETHGGFSSKPSICVHIGSSPSQPLVASADFRSLSTKTDVDLGPLGQYTIEKEGFRNAVTVMYVHVPSTSRKERFEWKRSSGPEVSNLGGRSSGLKCVRCATGKVVAAFALPGMSFSRMGKMAWTGGKADLGEAAELVILVTLCVLLKKGRRSKNSAVTAGLAANAC